MTKAFNSLVGALVLAAFGQGPAAWAAEPPAMDRGSLRSALVTRLLDGQTAITIEVPPGRSVDLTDPLRLDEAVAFALKNNFEVKAAGAKVDATDWEVVGAYGAYLPTINYSRSSGTERSAPASYSVNDQRIQDDTHHRRDRTWSVTQPVVDLTLISDILLRHKGQAAAEIEETGIRERVALQTVGAFYKMILARLSIRFAENYKAQLDRLNEQMAHRVEGGGAAQADLDRVKTRSVSAESAIIETKSSFDASLDEFRRLTGIVPMQLQLPASLVPAAPPTADEALSHAMRFNPEYLLSQRQAEVQEKESDKAYSRMLPKVNFEVSSSRTWNAGGAAKGASAAGGDDIFPYQNERRAMLTATWVFAGGTDIAQGLAAGAKAREALYKSMDTRTRVEEGVRVSFNALNAAQSRVVVLEQAIESNAKVVAAFEEQYLNASRPLFDLLDAYERFYTARLDLIRTVISEAQAGYQLRRQMGQLVQALKESEPRAQLPVSDTVETDDR